MPIRKDDFIEIKKSLEIELTSKTINPDRKLAIEQELHSISMCLEGEQ